MAFAAEGVNPIGFAVIGADRAQAGIVRDLWVDRAECMLRYYEVETGGRQTRAPAGELRERRREASPYRRQRLARRGSSPAVPAIRNPDKVTLLEEDKITAYYGAGTLYATAARAEPLL